MSRLRLLIWLALLLGGLGLMYWSYGQSRGERTAWTSAVLYVDETPQAGETIDRPGTRVTMRFLPSSPDAESVANALRAGGLPNAKVFTRAREEKIILLPDFDKAITEDMLASGRLPKPGAGELVAGHEASLKAQFTIDGRSLQVVGVLRRASWPFLRAYLLPEATAERRLFDSGNDSVRPGYLVPLAERKATEKLSEVYPKARFTPVAGMARVERSAYSAYWLGMVLFVTGGSALMISLFAVAASKVQNRWLGPPLAELGRRRRLFVAIHAVYFGICLIGMLLVYEFPAAQEFLLAQIQGAFDAPSGPLAVAAKAYTSGSILRAAAATLAINFFLGSLAMITVPSILVPGIGVLLSIVRAVSWGLLLAPTFLDLAGAMRLHTGTLLLEGEGYILATFFALLVPIYLCSPQEGPRLRSRYGRAVLLNLKGNLLVFLVLAVAAIYEAIEVIGSMP